MIGMRKTYDAAFKAKVALEAVKGEKTITHIASEFSVHSNQIRLWRNHLMEQLPELFSSRRPQQKKGRKEMEAELHQQIGQLKMELESRLSPLVFDMSSNVLIIIMI
jgi:putative transposase